MKRCLITGAGGFVGSHLFVHLLHNTTWDLVLTDSFRHRGKTDRITQQLTESHPNFLKRVKVITHDLVAPMSWQMIDEIGEIDYAINLASESHVDRSITDPRPFIENNVSVILTMLEWARMMNPKKFIHLSTDEVFGPAPEHYDFPEWDVHLPSNPYSASKAAQEDIIFSYWRTYKLPVQIARCMNMIGEMQDAEKFVPMTIKKVLAEKTVEVHASKEGIPGSRYYLHARNLADAILFIIRNTEPELYHDNNSLGSYNVVGEREVDNLEMAKMIAEIIGKELKYKLVDFHSSRPGHDLRYGLDGTKLSHMGWKPPMRLEDSLRNTVLWTLYNKKWLN